MVDSESHSESHSESPAESLSENEQAALHECQVAIEYVYRAYGNLLSFHHNLGHAMDRFAAAERALREAGHERRANQLRDKHLPAGALEGNWTYELVEAFSGGFLEDISEFESAVREELAAGRGHVTEREQQREWRERSEEF